MWYEALENQVKQNWDELKAALIARFGHRMTPMEVDEKLQNLHQDLKEDFQPFLHQFEELWLQLERTTHIQQGDYFKLGKFKACLHPRVYEKVELEEPTTYQSTSSHSTCPKQK